LDFTPAKAKKEALKNLIFSMIYESAGRAYVEDRGCVKGDKKGETSLGL
jgi:hypothetical protein